MKSRSEWETKLRFRIRSVSLKHMLYITWDLIAEFEATWQDGMKDNLSDRGWRGKNSNSTAHEDQEEDAPSASMHIVRLNWNLKIWGWECSFSKIFSLFKWNLGKNLNIKCIWFCALPNLSIFCQFPDSSDILLTNLIL